ncbi:MAG: hypothetical protein LM563_03175 [Thermofilum sp.]|nr:hypothetical protein [Thermofilum sp.]
MLRIRPLDTLFATYDEPFYVDVEADRPMTIDVFIDDATTSFNTLYAVPGVRRVTVWTENPIGSNPDSRIHTVTFKSRDTGETVRIDVAYYPVRPERVEFRPGKGSVLMGQATQMIVIGDKAFFRRLNVRRVAPINTPYHNQAYIEFVGFNELGDKFYYVIRQDKLLEQMAGQTDMIVTLKPVKQIPVTVEFDIPSIPLRYMLPFISRAMELIEGFITWAGGGTVAGYIVRFRVGVARFISKALGIHQEIVDVSVVGDRLRITYLMDAPPLGALVVIGLAVIAGAWILHALIGAIRDIMVEREQAVQTAEVMSAIRKVNEERTKAIEAAIQYAKEQNLTPEQVYQLIEAIGEQYTTGDIVKATQALEEADKWKAEAEKMAGQRYLYAVAGAGVGAILASIVKR